MSRAPGSPPLLAFAVAVSTGFALPTGCTVDSPQGADDGEAARATSGGLPGATPLFDDLEEFSGLPERPASTASGPFWEHWGDGRAELSGYRVTVNRYGEPRAGELSLIYVTEPHDRRTWIKDDAADPPHRVEVLKLIRNTRFLTGIYPYSVMTSVFSPVDAYRQERFSPVRINLAVLEWCGSVDHRVWPGADRLRSLRLSYFAGEGESLSEVDVPEGALYEDALLVQLRELDGAFAGGGDWEGWLIPELWRLRTGHEPLEPVQARVSRSNAVRDGEPVTRFVLETEGYRRTFDVERAPPRRVLGWETSTGERAEILSTERLAYWELNQPGDERHREGLGLHPGGPLPPGTDVPCAPDGA